MLSSSAALLRFKMVSQLKDDWPPPAGRKANSCSSNFHSVFLISLCLCLNIKAVWFTSSINSTSVQVHVPRRSAFFPQFSPHIYHATWYWAFLLIICYVVFKPQPRNDTFRFMLVGFWLNNIASSKEIRCNIKVNMRIA